MVSMAWMVWIYPSNMYGKDLPSGKHLHSELDNHHAMTGKTHYEWTCSIGMLNCQKVCSFYEWNLPTVFRSSVFRDHSQQPCFKTYRWAPGSSRRSRRAKLWRNFGCEKRFDSSRHLLVGGLEHFWSSQFFPYIGNNHPNWLIFFGGVETTNQLA